MSLFIHYYLLQVSRKHTVPKNKENMIYYSENDSNIAKKYKYTFLNFPFNGSCSCNDEKKPTDNKNFILTSFFLTVKLKCDHTDQLFWKTVQDNMQHENIDSSAKTLQHHNLQLTCKQPRVILFLFFFHPFLSSLSRFSIQVRLLAWMTSHTVNGGNYLSLFFLLFRFKRSQSCRQTLSNLSLAFRPHSIFRTSFKEINNNCYFLRQQHTSKQSDKIKFISNLTFIYTC